MWNGSVIRCTSHWWLGFSYLRPYLRIFVRIFGSKPLNRWRSRLEPRRARAPVVRRSARKRTPGGPKPSRTLSFPPHNALPRFHSSSASPLSTDSAAKAVLCRGVPRRAGYFVFQTNIPVTLLIIYYYTFMVGTYPMQWLFLWFVLFCSYLKIKT